MKTFYTYMRHALAVVVATVAQSAMAQHATVSGQVLTTDGTPLVGATVRYTGGESTFTDGDGRFVLPLVDNARQVVVSYIGYHSDSAAVGAIPLRFVLREDKAFDTLAEAEITTRRKGLVQGQGITNTITITNEELTKAACCNLGESFVTNPSVDVSYSDAATGARQIKLLGLSGSYVQMLTENVPAYRGAAAPFALGYMPGPWMQSIQVSKGAAQVKQGYESITGQINIEMVKPQRDEAINLNFYGDTDSRWEANADANLDLGKGWHTSLLGHYEDTKGHHDDNHDGLLDKPNLRQFHLQNRWNYAGGRYQMHASLRTLHEKRTGGQTHKTAMPTVGYPLYRIAVDTERYEAFVKQSYLLNALRGTNIALILSGNTHLQTATYGYRHYAVNQKNAYASLMYETDLTAETSLSLGTSYVYDYMGESYQLVQQPTGVHIRTPRGEHVGGMYGEYTYKHDDHLVLSAGLRWDHSSRWGSFITPRVHAKWKPIETLTLRASAGRGYRTAYALAEQHNLLASGRTIVLGRDVQEAANNYGLSAMWSVPLAGRTLTLNADYYYTHFDRQLIANYEVSPTELHLEALSGRSYAHTLQFDATYEWLSGFTTTAAYRYQDVRSTYNGVLMRKPLTHRYKVLLTASYRTANGNWQFDATGLVNGGGHLPNTIATQHHFSAYGQMSAQVTRWFKTWSVYIGGENLTNYKQANAIFAPDQPFSTTFEPTLVYGPLHGAMAYVGLRLRL
ncbi:MAG: TonB-dependent receptor [Bacteroidales bacterium]|nr:TonB-dependent receptor [Bacteroidales bacterium]